MLRKYFRDRPPPPRHIAHATIVAICGYIKRATQCFDFGSLGRLISLSILAHRNALTNLL